MTLQTKTIQILLIDDHALFRRGLTRLLEAETDFRVLGDCETVEQGLKVLRAQPVDLVLLDFDLGLQRAFQFQAQARSEGIERPVLIVTAGMSRPDAAQTWRLGARGLFVKHNSPQLLAQAIRRVASGGEWVDPAYATVRVDAAIATESAAGDGPGFSERERSVLRGVFEGLSNKEIADRLGASEAAVKAALQRLFQKTGVRTRSQLVRAALEQFPAEL